VSDQIERPWALMRHHAGWADVFHVDHETADSITGFYPDREQVGPPVNYSVRAVLARYTSMESARAAREAAVAEWRKHDAAVREAEATLHEAEKARENAWLDCLKDAASRS
jgi:multidrug resistance efflux pump